jgi:acetolactate synthase regulatory subunit
MAQLADALAYVSSRETERNEQALAACFPAPAINLTENAQAKLVPFVQWCRERGVRACPAQPTTVAAFIRWNIDLGVATDKILDTLEAIEALHNGANAANPVATQVVGDLLSGLIKVDAPRSWTADEKGRFNLLPPHIKRALARREQDREGHLRRRQNELAEEIKKAKRQNGADESVKEEIVTNGKEA